MSAPTATSPINIPERAKLVSIRTADEPSSGHTIWTLKYAAPSTSTSNSSSVTSSPSLDALSASGALKHLDLDGDLSRPNSGGSGRSSVVPHTLALECSFQTYAWGKLGMDSMVAQLAHANGEKVDAETPYAEMWVGTHPKAPSQVTVDAPWKMATPLADWLSMNSSATAEQGATGLPFLFKILSVRTALSIQAHPDLALAKELHAKRPDLYPDANHKPEMAIAITPFEALCGFRAAREVLAHCGMCPELKAVVGADAVDALAEALAGAEGEEATKTALRALYTRLMTAPEDAVKAQLASLTARLAAVDAESQSPVDRLALRIHAQYPGDVGVFCVYLLNFAVLQPGQALFMAANEPHAYVSGDCAECMAESDNVVRAGLTPKFKDTETLCDMLTYTHGPAVLDDGTPLGDHVREYKPPPEVTEFRLQRVDLPAGATATLEAASDAGVLVVVRGAGSLKESVGRGEAAASGPTHEVAKGAVRLVCADVGMTLRADAEGLLAFRAIPRNA